MPISKDEVVRLAYQLILGREPENDLAVEAHVHFESVYTLRERFMNSLEFQRQLAFMEFLTLLYGDEKLQREGRGFGEVSHGRRGR